MRNIFLISIFSTFLFAGWNREGDSVIDTKTHLQWQDDFKTQTSEKKWREAQIYCKNLEFLHHYDWRLPSLKELKSIVNATHNKKIFHTTDEAGYWTIDEDKKDSVNAWAIYFPNGHEFTADKCDTSHLRCVRYK